MLNPRFLVTLLLAVPTLAGCGADDKSDVQSSCSILEQSGCDAGKVCEAVKDGEPQCFAPLTLRGKVTDALDATPISGAHIVARDANGVAISSVAVSDAKGVY